VTTAKILDSLLVEPGKPAHLGDRDPGSRLGLDDKQQGLERLSELAVQIGELHDRLWAEATRSVLLVLQGLDAAGKDGTLKHVLTGVNPQGCRVVSFKEPTTTELAHDYLWRVHAACPARGELGAFNRSHYEDVAVARVHGLVPHRTWRRRYRHIREFERLLTDEGTTVVKVFLNLSKDGQARRLRERLVDPAKSWKFRSSDLVDRARWDDYIEAYDEAITETSTKWSPWHIVPPTTTGFATSPSPSSSRRRSSASTAAAGPGGGLAEIEIV